MTGVTAFSGMIPASPGRMQMKLQSRAMAPPVSMVTGSRGIMVGGSQHEAGNVRHGQSDERKSGRRKRWSSLSVIRWRQAAGCVYGGC